MENSKNIKIEKGKTYTYDEIKEIYKNAMLKTASDPTGGRKKEDAKLQVSLMLSGMVILTTMEDNMFEQEESHE